MIFHVLYGMVTSDSQGARPIHLLVSIWRKVWEDSICQWLLKQTGLVFCLIILKLSDALDGLFIVLSRLHGYKHKCTFCRMKHHWTWCDYFQILLLEIFSSMEPTRYLFSDIDAAMATFPHFGKYIFPQHVRLSLLCLVIALSALVHLI